MKKLFRSDKSFLGSKSMRVQSAESLSSKVFIEFVALIVRNRIYNLLKENTLQMESRPNYMTVPAAIRELEKIEMVKRNDGSYRLAHAYGFVTSMSRKGNCWDNAPMECFWGKLKQEWLNEQHYKTCIY